MGRVFANGPEDRGSIPGCVIPKTLKMVLDTSLLNTQQYKVRIKAKVEQTRERSSALPKSRCSSYWKRSFCSPSTPVASFTYGEYVRLSRMIQPMFLLRDYCWMCPCVIIIGGTTFILLTSIGRVLRFSCTRCSCLKYRFALSVGGLKTQNEEYRDDP